MIIKFKRSQFKGVDYFGQALKIKSQ